MSDFIRLFNDFPSLFMVPIVWIWMAVEWSSGGYSMLEAASLLSTAILFVAVVVSGVTEYR